VHSFPGAETRHVRADPYLLFDRALQVQFDAAERFVEQRHVPKTL